MSRWEKKKTQTTKFVDGKFFLKACKVTGPWDFSFALFSSANPQLER